MKTILRIIKILVTIMLLLVLFVVILQKVTHNKIALGDIYIFQIASESMLPEYRVGDVIVVKKTNASDLVIGDDVTYLGSASNLNGLIITHRLISKFENNGEEYYVTKGIANEIEDPVIKADNIYGKVVYHTVLFSFIGRLLTNVIAYYILFITVGVSFSYEIITNYFVKEDSEDEEETN